jgi:hypothetical protein
MDDTPREHPPAVGKSAGANTVRLPFGPADGNAPRRDRLIAVVMGCVAFAVIGCGTTLGGGPPEATQTLSRTFAVGQRPTLAIQDTAGNVTVTAGADGQVSVQVIKRVRDQSGAEAQRILNSVGVDMTQDGNTITVMTHFPSGGTPTSGSSPTVDIQITAPQASQLSADLGAGNVTIGRIAGQMNVTATAGNIEAQKAIFAGSSHFAATAGNITLDGEMNSASLLQAEVKTGNITLRLPAPISAHLDARTEVGAVTVSGWPIAVTRVGTTGAQAVGDLRPGPTDQITLRVSTGSITVGQR